MASSIQPSPPLTPEDALLHLYWLIKEKNKKKCNALERAIQTSQQAVNQQAVDALAQQLAKEVLLVPTKPAKEHTVSLGSITVTVDQKPGTFARFCHAISKFFGGLRRKEATSLEKIRNAIETNAKTEVLEADWDSTDTDQVQLRALQYVIKEIIEHANTFEKKSEKQIKPITWGIKVAQAAAAIVIPKDLEAPKSDKQPDLSKGTTVSTLPPTLLSRSSKPKKVEGGQSKIKEKQKALEDQKQQPIQNQPKPPPRTNVAAAAALFSQQPATTKQPLKEPPPRQQNIPLHPTGKPLSSSTRGKLIIPTVLQNLNLGKQPVKPKKTTQGAKQKDASAAHVPDESEAIVPTGEGPKKTLEIMPKINMKEKQAALLKAQKQDKHPVEEPTPVQNEPVENAVIPAAPEAPPLDANISAAPDANVPASEPSADESTKVKKKPVPAKKSGVGAEVGASPIFQKLKEAAEKRERVLEPQPPLDQNKPADQTNPDSTKKPA